MSDQPNGTALPVQPHVENRLPHVTVFIDRQGLLQLETNIVDPAQVNLFLDRAKLWLLQQQQNQSRIVKPAVSLPNIAGKA